MKSDGAGIRYRWMRRVIQGIALAAGSVALLGSLSAGVASAATQSPSDHVQSAAAARPMSPPTMGSCYAGRGGWTWTDEDTGRVWECVQNILGQWMWVEITTIPPGECYLGNLIAIRPDQATAAAGHICSP